MGSQQIGTICVTTMIMQLWKVVATKPQNIYTFDEFLVCNVNWWGGEPQTLFFFLFLQ